LYGVGIPARRVEYWDVAIDNDEVACLVKPGPRSTVALDLLQETWLMGIESSLLIVERKLGSNLLCRRTLAN
jgi:hypothetical protein